MSNTPASHTDPGATSGTAAATLPRRLLVFIAYRQGPNEGNACAEWLHTQLTGSTLDIPAENRAIVETYLDVRSPALSDWTEKWLGDLKTARALILVCTPGVVVQRDERDWLYREIDWWVKRRKMAPILIDASGAGEQVVPPAVAAKWPMAQRLSWSQHSTDDEKRVVLERLREGLLLSYRGVNYEELKRHARKNRVLASAGLLVASLAVGLYLTSRNEVGARALAHATKLAVDGRSLLTRASALPSPPSSSHDRQSALALAMYAVGRLLDLNQPVPPEVEALLRRAASANSTLRVFDGEGPTQYSTAPITWSPDGRKLFVPAIRSVATLDGSVLMSDVTSAAWNPDGSRMAYSKLTAQPVITLRKETTGIPELTRNLQGVYALAPLKWNRDLTRFATRGQQSEIEIGLLLNPIAIGSWDEDLTQTRPVPSLYRWDWSPDGTMLLVVGASDQSDPNRIVKIIHHSREPVSLPAIPAGNQVLWDPTNQPIAISPRGRLEVFDALTGKFQSAKELGPTSIGFPVAIHPRGVRYIASASEGWLFVWDSEGKRQSTITAPNPFSATVHSISWSPDGSKVAFHVTSPQVNQVVIHDAAFAFATSHRALLAAAGTYLSNDFTFSQDECRQYFESIDCPDVSTLFEFAR